MYEIGATEVREMCKVCVVDNSFLKTIHARMLLLQLAATSQSRFLKHKQMHAFAADVDQVHSTGALRSPQDMPHS